MTPGERERLTDLCQRIAEEKNNQKLAELLQQLHSVLDGKEQSTKPKSN